MAFSTLMGHEQSMNFPTMLTISRLVVAIIIGWPFLIFGTKAAAWIALLLFALASITDFLDGYLARKWNQVSELGRMLDPIADKAMVIIAVAILIGLSDLSWTIVLPASVIFFREVLVSGMREFLGDRARGLAVTNLAKWKTAAQMVSISVIFLGFATASAGIGLLGVALFWVAAALTVITGADYARKAVGLING